MVARAGGHDGSLKLLILFNDVDELENFDRLPKCPEIYRESWEKVAVRFTVVATCHVLDLLIKETTWPVEVF